MSNNTFLAISDSHLEDALFNLPELRQDLFDYYSNAVDKAIELKVKYFISVGDLFETNKPNQETIDFVKNQNDKLSENGITPLAICGDHSKAINNITWEQIANFKEINIEPTFIGIAYNDNPDFVKEQFLAEIFNKKDTVEAIFLHTQIPSLFGFCEEKKTVTVDWDEVIKLCPNLKACVFGDIHSGIHKIIKPRDIFFGYCGSTGVTALDEIREKHYVYYNGENVELLPYELIRDFFEFSLTEESLPLFNKENEIEALKNSFKKKGRKPVYIIRYHKHLYKNLLDFSFLYDLAIVRTTILPTDKTLNSNISIRSEISNEANQTEVLELVLKENGAFTEEIRDTGIELLESLINNNTKDILNNLKKAYIT
jgi:DNA repair exonuclease SbcCD nuclease subunit